jgi:hypothetical protein
MGDHLVAVDLLVWESPLPWEHRRYLVLRLQGRGVIADLGRLEIGHGVIVMLAVEMVEGFRLPRSWEGCS